MPLYGGLTPGFERYGGGTPALKRIVESIGAQRGTAYDATQPSNVYPENLAIARVIDEAWHNNARMANQWDSARMTDFIPRWEKILALHPALGETDTERRARISLAFAALTQIGIYQIVYDRLLVLLGSDVFVDIVLTGTDNAIVWTPTGYTALNSSSADISLHDATGLLNFYSNIAHILVRITQPAGMTDGDFYSKAASINPVLDNLLPAWVTWDWYRQLHSGAKGFYLYDPAAPYAPDLTSSGVNVNLNNEVFDA